MTWFKVDDTLAFHAKAVAAGNAAMGLWVRAGSWASQQLTDGYVPSEIAATMGTRAEAKRLVAVHLWVEKDSGYLFWQWGEDGRQPSKVQVEADRHAARERQRKAREKAKSQRESHRDDGVTDAVTDSVSHAGSHGHVTPVVTVPPTRPDPTIEELKLGGQRPETSDPAAARCTAHRGVEDPGPCRGCMTARESAEKRSDSAKLAAIEARRNCRDCGGSGWIETEDGLPAGKCTHQRRTG